MPKIIDAEEKIRQICEAAYLQFTEQGVNGFSLNNFIISLNMSKGQFYHYFESKEDLAFEVVRHKTEELGNQIEKNIGKEDSLRGKLHRFFECYIDDSNKHYASIDKIIKEILHLYINSDNPKVKAFNEEMYSDMHRILDCIFEEAIQKNKLPKHYIKYSKITIAVADGMYFRHTLVDSFDLKKELSEYLDDIAMMFEGAGSERESENL